MSILINDQKGESQAVGMVLLVNTIEREGESTIPSFLLTGVLYNLNFFLMKMTFEPALAFYTCLLVPPAIQLRASDLKKVVEDGRSAWTPSPAEET